MFRSEEEFKKIIDKAKVDTRPDPVYRQKLRQQMLLTFEAQKRKPDAPETLAFETKQSIIIKLKDRLTTMKNITKIAAALIIVTGIVGMIFIFSTGKPSFARIVEPLFNARTVTFKLTVQIERQPAQTLETMFMEPGLMRQTMPDGSIQIEDMTKRQMLRLNPEIKTATFIEFESLPDNQNQEYFLEIRNTLRQAQEDDPESVRELGASQIEGQPAFGYQISKPSIEITIWAHADNLQPIRIEMTVDDLKGIKGKATLHDFEFDVDLDESLFSLEPPEGYKVNSRTMDASQPSEKDLINLLGMTKDIPDSQLPTALNITAMREFLEPLRNMFDKDQDLNDQQKTQQYVALVSLTMRGLTFLQLLPAESDWHYVGKSVKVGQSDTPIFWYKIEGADTYRVIYADLTVKDLSADQLPKAPDAQTKDSQKNVMDVSEVIKK